MNVTQATAPVEQDEEEAALVAAVESARAEQEAGPVDLSDPAPAASEETKPADASASDGGDQQPAEDPLAGLPQAARDAIALIPKLQADLAQAREMAGRVPSLQSALDKIRSNPLAGLGGGDAPLQLEKVKRLREDGLDEIADAIEEAARYLTTPRQQPQATASPEPTTQAPAKAPDLVDVAAEMLDDVRPTWAEDLSTPEFQAWFARQPVDFQQEMRTTAKPSVILRGLKQYDEARSAARTAAPATNQSLTADQRRARMSAAVTPQGSGRAPQPNEVDEEEAAFLSVFAQRR